MGNMRKLRKLAVLVDLDGTLVDVSGIRHHVTGPNIDFDSFHRESINCPPNKRVVRILKVFRKLRISVIIVSARSEKYRSLTNMWLAINSIQCTELIMRDIRDGRSDIDVKTSIHKRVSSNFYPVAAIDDRYELVKNWKALGIPFVYHVS
jgi:hypothetical protein